MFEGKYLGAWNLVDGDGKKKDYTLTISDVKAEKVVLEGGQQNKKPLIRFERTELPMVCCKTNAKTIAAMYGNDTSKWVGRRITLFATTTQVGGQEKDCIRVRPTIPTEKEAPRAPAQA
jgi:hypothetical protein